MEEQQEPPQRESTGKPQTEASGLMEQTSSLQALKLAAYPLPVGA